MSVIRIGAARIVPSDAGTYRLSLDGDWAAILPVRDEDHELVNLCAWFPDAPGRWWLRFSDECFFLGARALTVAAYFGDPIELHATSEAWAVAGGRGACALRWDVDLRPWFEGISAVRCDSQTLAARFQTAMRRWEPKTTISRVETHHAA